MRLLQPIEAIFYNHKWRVQGGLLQEKTSIVYGFPVRQILICERSGGIKFNPGYFLPIYEMIYLFTKTDFKLSKKANALGCVWRINQETNQQHSAPFPFELATGCIESVGKGPVLEPFMGSGTTAVAAEILCIDWIGIEKSKDCVEMANELIQQTLSRLL